MATVVLISDYLPLLTPDLPGIQTNVATMELKNAIRNFCIDTEIWNENLTAINIVAGTVKYALVPSYDAAIHRLFKVEIEGIEKDAEDFYLRQDDSLSEYVIELVDTPLTSVTGGLEVEVILRPFLKSDEIPEYFFDLWATPIMANAKSNLMLQPAKPYSNPQMGMKYLADYKMGVLAAKREKYIRHTQSDMAYTPRSIL